MSPVIVFNRTAKWFARRCLDCEHYVETRDEGKKYPKTFSLICDAPYGIYNNCFDYRTLHVTGVANWGIIIQLIRARDNYKCVKPNKDECKGKLDVHHITPIEKGGTERLDNLACLCSGHHGILGYDGCSESFKKRICIRTAFFLQQLPNRWKGDKEVISEMMKWLEQT